MKRIFRQISAWLLTPIGSGLSPMDDDTAVILFILLIGIYPVAMIVIIKLSGG